LLLILPVSPRCPAWQLFRVGADSEDHINVKLTFNVTFTPWREVCSMLPIRTILYPTDFSEHSDYAFQLACSLARDYGACLFVLHVLERPLLAYTGVMTAPPSPPPSAEERQAVQEKLHRIEPPDPTTRVEHLLEEGDPATAILQVAQERKCDLIVLGTHGRGGLGRLLMGSVAEQVVRKASCPVLTVRTPLSQTSPAAAPTSETAGSAVGAAKG
jgi:nucleotide-binding universal stress UspA family protein